MVLCSLCDPPNTRADQPPSTYWSSNVQVQSLERKLSALSAEIDWEQSGLKRLVKFCWGGGQPSIGHLLGDAYHSGDRVRQKLCSNWLRSTNQSKCWGVIGWDATLSWFSFVVPSFSALSVCFWGQLGPTWHFSRSFWKCVTTYCTILFLIRN